MSIFELLIPTGHINRRLLTSEIVKRFFLCYKMSWGEYRRKRMYNATFLGWVIQYQEGDTYIIYKIKYKDSEDGLTYECLI